MSRKNNPTKKGNLAAKKKKKKKNGGHLCRDQKGISGTYCMGEHPTPGQKENIPRKGNLGRKNIPPRELGQKEYPTKGTWAEKETSRKGELGWGRGKHHPKNTELGK